jgi:hypothetical protein
MQKKMQLTKKKGKFINTRRKSTVTNYIDEWNNSFACQGPMPEDLHAKGKQTVPCNYECVF